MTVGININNKYIFPAIIFIVSFFVLSPSTASALTGNDTNRILSELEIINRKPLNSTNAPIGDMADNSETASAQESVSPMQVVKSEDIQVGREAASQLSSANQAEIGVVDTRADVVLASAETSFIDNGQGANTAGSSIYKESKLTSEQTTMAYRTAAVSAFIGVVLIVSTYIPQKTSVRQERIQFRHSSQHSL